MTKTEFIYTTYIKASPTKIWRAITNPEFMKQYWFGMYCTSEWKAGSPWQLHFPDGEIADAGEIIACKPPKRLAIKWRNEWKPALKAEGYSLCTFDIEPRGKAVKLTVPHSLGKARSKFIAAISDGWPKVLSNMKTLLESGTIVLEKTGH